MNTVRQNQFCKLFDTLKSWDCTVLVTDEIEVRPQSVSAGRLGFLTDGIMNTYYLRSGNGRVRALEVLKCGTVRILDKIVPFEINSKGISVYPNKNNAPAYNKVEKWEKVRHLRSF